METLAELILRAYPNPDLSQSLECRTTLGALFKRPKFETAYLKEFGAVAGKDIKDSTDELLGLEPVEQIGSGYFRPCFKHLFLNGLLSPVDTTDPKSLEDVGSSECYRAGGSSLDWRVGIYRKP